MWVLFTPAMSAATGDTAVSSSYQPSSMGSRDSACALIVHRPLGSRCDSLRP